jgi:peptidylprolyl isomerase
MKTLLICIALAIFTNSCSEKGETEVLVKLTTTHGDIKLKLFNETPGHRDNFLKLVNEGFYDNIDFHRVIDTFMIQTGNPANRSSYVEGADISRYRYTIPAEIDTAFFHRKGAVAAARTGDNGNPLRNSSGTQFYIVQGRVWNSEKLVNQEIRINNSIRENLYFRYMAEEKARLDSTGVELSQTQLQELAVLRVKDYFETAGSYVMPEHHKAVYMSEGGSPHLDMNYTVFGQVIEGLAIIDSIAKTKKDDSGNPIATEKKILKAEIVKK